MLQQLSFDPWIARPDPVVLLNSSTLITPILLLNHEQDSIGTWVNF